MENNFDLVIIGAGPGGYTAAIKAAKCGLKTALIENREIGGTCLNRGCIPTKTLMHSSHLYYEAMNMEKFGVRFSELSYDINKIYDRKNQVVKKIRDGIGTLLKANQVTVIKGTASVQGPGKLCVTSGPDETGKEYEEKMIYGDKILIAAGSRPFLPGIEGIGSRNVVTSDELLAMEEKLYSKLLIIGGGVIGVEFATIYQELGCEVEMIEVADRILPSFDKEISKSVAMNLKKRGIKIHTRSKVVKIEEKEELYCSYEENTGRSGHNNLKETDIVKKPVRTVTAGGILVCTGRRANTDRLFASGILVEMDGDKIKTDYNFETSVKGIYAIGDVIKGTQLAHAAAAQGIAAVEAMCGAASTIDLKVIPSCIYTSPEVAVTGLSEEEAVLAGYSVKTGKYPMSGNAKTVLSMDDRSYIKVISDAATDRILGAQILCARATDMIGEFSTAIVNGLTGKELAAVIRPHPTYMEAVTEAVEDIEGMAIHLVPGKR